MILLGCLVIFASANQALAQSGSGTNTVIAEDLQPLLDSAKEKGLSVIIVTPEEKTDVEEKAGPPLSQRALKVRSELKRIISNAGKALPHMGETLRKASPDGSIYWLLIAIVTAVGGIGIGIGPSILIRRWGRKYFSNIYEADPKNRVAKISYLMFRALMMLVNCIIFFIIAMLVAVIFDSGHDPSRATIFVIVSGYTVYWIFRIVIFFNIIAPDLPSHRMINLDDDAANMMQRDWRNTIPIIIIALGVCVWMDLLGLNRDTHKLFLMSSMLLSVILLGFLSYKHRREFAGVILGAGDPTTKALWRRSFANSWHILAIVYLAVSWVVSSVRLILDLPSAITIIIAPLVAFIVSLAVFGLVLIIIDRLYVSRQKRFEERVAIAHEQTLRRREAERLALEEALENPPEDDEELVVNQVMAATDIDEMPVFRPVFKALLEQAAGVLVTILAIGYVLGTWDVNIGEQGNPVTAFFDTLSLIFIGWFLYRAVAAYIDNQLAEEGDDGQPQEGEPGDEMSGQGATRLSTLLPLVRNVLIATIIILTGMVILSNMGVDIAPLFAGAGVIGLAVGFGAQTLIRDIFSGGFFLFDDAFRKGEYIELGTIRGTVEKISLRSFQLRHHNGPLHTIPFGEITQLTNYSRDWVMMKLPLRLTYDTDVERVRKLVKKLGQGLLEHPEVGHLFLQAVKSQGVYKMEDSAMIIRLKFMTKPGDQFVTRKVVYAAIRELFEKEGIKFANKEVTVRLAEEPAQPLSAKDKQAIAASAARAVADDEAQTPAVVDDGP